jgi:hypothetical protein
MVSSIWQGPVPNLIPMEFQELPGFRPESVEDSKDLLNAVGPAQEDLKQNKKEWDALVKQQRKNSGHGMLKK